MANRGVDSRVMWLAVGVVVGLCIAYFWPHEPALAAVTDRGEDYALATCTVSFGDTLEGVFVLDFLTGRLSGAVLNTKVGKFGNFYYRSLADDFRTDPNSPGRYTIVTGKANLPSQGRLTLATGVVYVAEFDSGLVACYAFPYAETARTAQPVPIEIVMLDRFPFRQAINQ
mgnify:CR=1 FL=1